MWAGEEDMRTDAKDLVSNTIGARKKADTQRITLVQHVSGRHLAFVPWS